MNKNELIKYLVNKTEMNQRKASEAVNIIFEGISATLSKGEKVSLMGFGNFEVRERGARKGRNPQTGQEIQISSSKVPAFKPAKTLKSVVNL
jgi:DNA-binding protein HU-beta